jgi:hypothetical protein
LSGLLLINFWSNFIQTLQNWSVSSLVVRCPSVCHKTCLNIKLAIMWSLIALVENRRWILVTTRGYLHLHPEDHMILFAFYIYWICGSSAIRQLGSNLSLHIVLKACYIVKCALSTVAFEDGLYANILV